MVRNLSRNWSYKCSHALRFKTSHPCTAFGPELHSPTWPGLWSQVPLHCASEQGRWGERCRTEEVYSLLDRWREPHASQGTPWRRKAGSNTSSPNFPFPGFPCRLPESSWDPARSHFLWRDHASLARSRFLWRDYASSGKSDGGSGLSGLIQLFSKLFQTSRAYQPIIAGPKVSTLTHLR